MASLRSPIARPFPRLAALLLLTLALASCGGKKAPTAPTPVEPTPTPPTQPQPTPPAQPTPTPPPPSLRFTKFVGFGDSMTEGVTSATPTLLIRLDAPQAYPAILQGLLSLRYSAQTITVGNRGIAGEQAVDGLPRFIDVLRQDAPQVVIILEGFNDLTAFGDRGITRAVGAVESMVKEARARGVAVLLATLPPERPGGPKTLPTSIYNEFNRQITGTASDEGAQLIDLSHEMSVSSIGIDGIHPTEAGYQEMAGIYFKHIQSLYEQPAQTTAAPAATH